MTENKTSQYSLDCASFNIKTLKHKVGRIKHAWAGCQFFPFKPGGVKIILLTSPFIERAARTQRLEASKLRIAVNLDSEVEP
jgi:hypothetical protein